MPGTRHRATVAVAAGRPGHRAGAPVNQGIEMSSTFVVGDEREYLRGQGNASWRAFEDTLGELEGGQAVAFGSGMAAIAAVLEGLPVGSTVIAGQALYSGTSALLDEQLALGRVAVRRAELDDTAAAIAVIRADPHPALVWLETPANPLVTVADVAALAAAGHEVGARVVVDNTWNTPLLLRPIEHGADVVVHSVTKYLAGHSDLLMGAVVCASSEVHAELEQRRRLTGGIPGALETYLALRGIRTLAVRMERAQANAGVLAARLAEHPVVARVRYPGLPDDPGHAVAARQQDGFGAMLSFDVHGGAAAADRICAAVELITPATSLGGVESLIERRGRYPIDAANGTPDNLIRFSTGIEHLEDLWADLSQALARAR